MSVAARLPTSPIIRVNHKEDFILKITHLNCRSVKIIPETRENEISRRENIIKTSIDFHFEGESWRKIRFFMVLRKVFSHSEENKTHFMHELALMYGIRKSSCRTSCKPHGLIFVTQMISRWKSKFNLCAFSRAVDFRELHFPLHKSNKGKLGRSGGEHARYFRTLPKRFVVV
jgi:hypothetical protein